LLDCLIMAVNDSFIMANILNDFHLS